VVSNSPPERKHERCEPWPDCSDKISVDSKAERRKKERIEYKIGDKTQLVDNSSPNSEMLRANKPKEKKKNKLVSAD
jgi:hypothetical protein